MKTKVAVAIDVESKSPKYCGSKCLFRNHDSTLCFLLGEERLQWLKEDHGKALRSAYCRRQEIKD